MSDPVRSSNHALSGVMEDFPDWVDPMVVKELRQGLRARWFVVPFLAAQAAALTLIWVEYAATLRQGTPFASVDFGHSLFWALVFVLVGVVLPLRALTGLGSEMTGEGARLMLLSGLSRWRIVLGKWLTQMFLSALVLVSLLPYGLVRYFFGGVEWLPNALTLGAALGVTAAMNALVLGASGYRDYWVRAVITLTGWVYVGAPAVAVWPFLMHGPFPRGAGAGRWMALAWMLWLGLGMVLQFAFFCLCGLQMARTRLRVGLHPGEVAPSGPVLLVFFLAPLYLLLPALITCGLGWTLAVAVMLWWMWSMDRADTPPRSRSTLIHPNSSATPKTYRF